MMNVLSGLIRGADSGAHSLPGRLPSLRETRRKKGKERQDGAELPKGKVKKEMMEDLEGQTRWR